MLFNSLDFLIFFPIVFILYFVLPQRFRWIHLLFSSCIFYMAFKAIYILILFFTIIIDYLAGIYIEKAKTQKIKKKFLVLSLTANICVLAIFKYYNFLNTNISGVLSSFGYTNDIPYLAILLPIGLSFHTFQAMSYTIEVYRGKQKAEKHFGIYSLYVMFFPQLVAGPIERPQNMLPQFREKHFYSNQNLLDGLRLMLWGFFKKLVIADRLSIYVNTVYNHPGEYHFLNLIIATLFFAIQIYCDFSGYSDIAIGAAKTMNFNLMINFERPYFSKNIQDFWKRWHISLSTWFKDYLYISLGGNKVTLKRVFFNIAIVFLISGLWHGANSTFVIWGALHALFFILYILVKDFLKIKLPDNVVFNFCSILFTFSLTTFAWIFFRANTLNDALIIVKHIFYFNETKAFSFIVRDLSKAVEFGMTSTFIALTMCLIMIIVELKLKPNLENINYHPLLDVLFFSTILSLIIIFGIFHNSSFIYFQF
jgi:alginate O-acetyltransferase complex protein AlgI